MRQRMKLILTLALLVSPVMAQRCKLVPPAGTLNLCQVRMQPTGRHFSLIIYDDVVVQDAITTPEQIKKTTTQWELSLNLGSTHDPRYQYAGTRYAYGDTYGTILQRAAVKPRIHPATYNGQMDGEPVFLAQQRWEEIKKLHLPTP